MLTLYGIPNCDTVKKARTWLEAAGLDYHFHDYKKVGIDVATLQRWCKELGFEQVLNQRGTTWRKLPEAQRTNTDLAQALQLMQAQPSLIKRPILDTGAGLLQGFDATRWQAALL